MNVTIWNENVHERTEDHVCAIYPSGIHGVLAAALADTGTVRTATLEQPEHGLPPGVLDATDVLVFVSSFAGGEVFRGGCCFRRGRGRIFYFSPGDQDYPVYHHPDVQRVIANAVRWAAPVGGRQPVPDAPESPRGWFQ